MANQNNNKSSIFQKMIEAGHTLIDAQIFKAKTTILNSDLEDEFFFGKAIVEDPTFSLHSQGYLDKPYRITNAHLKQMSYQDTVIAGVIQTRQNQVSSYSTLVTSPQKKGWRLKLRDEDQILEKIKEELKAEMEVASAMTGEANPAQDEAELAKDPVQKAETTSEGTEPVIDESMDTNPEDNNKSDDEVELYNFELERKAKEKLEKQFEAARKVAQDYLLNCGKTENRPFETKRWNFDGALRAWTRDSLTYDLYATEKVPDRAGRPHHWFPMDGGSVKRASRELRKFRDMAQNFYNIDILYPEKEQAQEKQKAIELDPVLLEKDAYKWVQIIRGKVERAYTADELAVGIRNVNTDIFNNGYGISELELLVSMITGHLNAEYYNQAYFTQGFSAKGILHIKAALNKRKVESVRTQWHHMLKGTKNAFQTPIFAGVEDVKWIPLTQNHNDIGFEGWMRYLVTMIGAIYQIDPAELGIHFKAEGGGGSLGNKDATQEKIDNSKDRGLYPLLRHLQNYINEEILKPFDSRFILEFTGVDGENQQQTLLRQEKEAKFKKTLNEIRAEDGLPPLPGCDDLILGPEYIQWYTQFSPKAQEKQKSDQKAQSNQMQMQMDHQQKMAQGQEDQAQPETPPNEDIYGEGALHMNNQPFVQKSSKPLVIEYYKLEK